ncbi:unnamed protein product, partial [Staurois parvus]
DSPQVPGRRQEILTEETSVCKQYRSLPSAPARWFVLLCIAEQYKAVCLHSKVHTDKIVTQHTVNPLITPDVNPFLPSAITTVSVLFISIDHCIGVTGDVSDTKSVPSSVRMPAAVLQSRYNLL